MKVLINAVGKRRQFVEAYQARAADRGGAAIAADSDPLAPAMAGPGAVATPLMNDPDNRTKWHDLIGEHGVTHLVSLIDTDQEHLAGLAAETGTVYLGPPEQARALAFDKYAFFTALTAAEVPVVPTALEPIYESDFISKDRSGSRGSNVLYHRKGDVVDADPDRRVFQPALDGPHIDIDFFFDGETLVATQKEVLSKADGESFRLRFMYDDEIERLVRRFAEMSGYRGVGNLDVWRHEGEWVLMELNPRYGGNYPASHSVGIDLIDCQIAMTLGQALPTLDPRAVTGKEFVKSWWITPDVPGNGPA